MITSYKEGELPKVLELVNRVQNHLTAGIVSNDQHFLNEVLGNTINGTIYAGIRARTTGAPQQMWFGPSGDPRSGVGTHAAALCCTRLQALCATGCGPRVTRLRPLCARGCSYMHMHTHVHVHNMTCIHACTCTT